MHVCFPYQMFPNSDFQQIINKMISLTPLPLDKVLVYIYKYEVCWLNLSWMPKVWSQRAYLSALKLTQYGEDSRNSRHIESVS